MEITDVNQLDMNGVYSYADYLLWKFQERVELFKGKVFKMSPAPSSLHQDISGNLHGELYSFFKIKPCKLYAAPFDVRLPKKEKEDKEIFTVVQPDLCVICDKSKIDKKGCVGAPDLIIEILSIGNSKKEMNNKFELYQESGVREYWIVDPANEVVLRYVLEGDKFIGLPPISDNFVTSQIFPDLKIHTNLIFNYK